MRLIFLSMVRIYKYMLSPLVPAACRFTPTCSEYAGEAIAKHGAIKGSWLAFTRILRCHPFGGYHYDPVPCAKAKAGEI